MELFRELIGNLNYTSIIALTPKMKKQSREIFSGFNLNSFIGISQQNEITKYALWLMQNILQHQKGGMMRRPLAILDKKPTGIPTRGDVTEAELNLHDYVVKKNNMQRKKQTPSMRYIFMLCLLAGIALFLIIQSYQRLMDLSMTITETTEENTFLRVLNEVLKEEDTNQLNDGGFTFYIWNSLAKMANLNRMPTQNDADIVRVRLMQEITHDFSSEFSRSLIKCGGVLVPRRDEYPVGFQGTIAYNLAMNLAAATNIAGGSAPFLCASSVMGTKTSFVLTKFMADSTISMAEITSKITIIKNLMSYAFYILAFVVPNAVVLIKNALSPDDIALTEYRENLDEGVISVNITQKEKSPESTTLRIHNAGRRFKNKVTKRKSKQIKRTKTRRF